MTNNKLDDPSKESTIPDSRTNDTLTRKDPSTVGILDSGYEVCVTSEGILCMGADDLNNHEVPTQTPERTTKEKLEKPTDTSRGEQHFVALVTDSRNMSYDQNDIIEWTSSSGARVNMTP